MKKQTNFKEAENLMNKLKDQGFKIKPNEVRKSKPKYDYDVKHNGKNIITILPRSNCFFKYIGIISDGKLATIKTNKDLEKLYGVVIEFKNEITSKEKTL